jgi:hypothetical protein
VVFKRASGKRRTGYLYADSTPKMPKRGPIRTKPVEPVKDAGTVKAQLIGKLGTRGYGRLLEQLREAADE